MIRSIYLLIASILLIGCNPPWWPAGSKGGYASHYIYTPPFQSALKKDKYLFYLNKQLACLIAKTKKIQLSKAAKCYPARMMLLNELAIRISQEIVSGLAYSAYCDLNLYENNLNELIKLNKRKGCLKHPKSKSWEQLKKRSQ